VDGVNSKTNPSKTLKENLEAEDHLKLLHTPCLNETVKDAFIFSFRLTFRRYKTAGLG
jgi:hypothetical protein